jgi:hypothetical protein
VTRTPLTWNLLYHLLNLLNWNIQYNERLMGTGLSLAFADFLKFGEFTYSAEDPSEEHFQARNRAKITRARNPIEKSARPELRVPVSDAVPSSGGTNLPLQRQNFLHSASTPVCTYFFSTRFTCTTLSSHHYRARRIVYPELLPLPLVSLRSTSYLPPRKVEFKMHVKKMILNSTFLTFK